MPVLGAVGFTPFTPALRMCLLSICSVLDRLATVSGHGKHALENLKQFGRKHYFPEAVECA